MFIKYSNASLAGLTAAAVTTAAFAKLFLPFYLIGSTAVFVVTSAIAGALVAAGWRQVYQLGTKVGDILLLLAAFYGLVIANFLLLSRPVVPTTHLFGILIFHFLFMVFGFAASRALRIVVIMLLGAAIIYLMVIAQYTLRFGDLMAGGYLQDIFGVGNRVQAELYGDQPVAVYAAFHQKIGITLALAALAALGLASSPGKRILAVGLLLTAMLLMFHIAARGAMVALVCSLIFLAVAELWVRSKKLAVSSAIAVMAATVLASGLFFKFAVYDKDIDPIAPDAISRTIREIQAAKPGLRLEIWNYTWHRISAEPDRLLLGRGIGIYPVDRGFGPPDWLLHRTTASHFFPHNVHLEMLYETGVVGLLLFTAVTLFPLVILLRRWHLLSLIEKSAVSMYVFQLAGSELSGSFAYSYLDQFFFALTVGIIALQRTRDRGAPIALAKVGAISSA